MATEKAASRRKWSKHEIVGDETVEVAPETPVSDALQAAADAPQAPDAEELIAAQPETAGPEITVTVRVAPLKVERIEQARALLELAECEPGAASLVPEGIQAFKDTDGRTMHVVVADGSLYKQEV